jgi:hypothetical protein
MWKRASSYQNRCSPVEKIKMFPQRTCKCSFDIPPAGIHAVILLRYIRLQGRVVIEMQSAGEKLSRHLAGIVSSAEEAEHWNLRRKPPTVSADRRCHRRLYVLQNRYSTYHCPRR